MSDVAEDPVGRPGRRRVRLAALGLTTVAVLALAAVMNLPRAGGADAPAAPPSDLLGLWTTDDPRYEGRALEITDSMVVFHTGLDEPRSHRIREVRLSEVGHRRKVVLGYGSDASTDRLTLTVGDGPPPVLRIVNSADVAWTRESPAR